MSGGTQGPTVAVVGEFQPRQEGLGSDFERWGGGLPAGEGEGCPEVGVGLGGSWKISYFFVSFF